MTVLVTGVAGFIGSHVALALIERGERVVGIDNLNDYYDPKLKNARLERIRAMAPEGRFTFLKRDIGMRDCFEGLEQEGIDRIVHLAAQAGVRYSLINPHAYIETNVTGHLNVLEFCRSMAGGIKHLVYASSSSVYGGNTKLPFSVEDRVDHPISLYAASKRMDELMSHTYAHLFRIPSTGLRFFTVYGPWGRPDMAAFIFTRQILEGEAISVFNQGNMSRDFTYIDDIVRGVIACLDGAPEDNEQDAPHRVYNIGNNKPEPLMRMIELIERETNCKAELRMLPMQPGDVHATYADIEAIQRDHGFDPSVPIDVGIPRFVQWYREYHGV